jgi:hypothetical protein
VVVALEKSHGFQKMPTRWWVKVLIQIIVFVVFVGVLRYYGYGEIIIEIACNIPFGFYSCVFIFSFLVLLGSFIIAYLVIIYSCKGQESFWLVVALILFYSYPSVLKALFIRNHIPLPLEVKLALFYFIQCGPLYIVFCMAIMSFLNPNLAGMLRHYDVGWRKFLRYLFKTYKLEFVIFWDFLFVYIFFDSTRGIIDSEYFSFQTISKDFFSTAMRDFGGKEKVLVSISCLIALMLPAIFAFPHLEGKKNNGGKINLSPFNEWLSRIEGYSYGLEKGVLKGLGEWLKSLSPLGLQGFIFITYLFGIGYVLYLANLWELLVKNMGYGVVWNEVTWRTIKLCLWASVVAIVMCVAFFFASKKDCGVVIYNKAVSAWGVKFFLLFFLVMALMPGNVVGYIINNLVGDYWRLGTILGLFFAYMIFPLYLIDSGVSRYVYILRASNTSGALRGLYKVFRLLSGEMIAGALFFLVLACNDSSSISSSMNIPVDNFLSKDLFDKVGVNPDSTGFIPVQLVFASMFLAIFPLVLRLKKSWKVIGWGMLRGDDLLALFCSILKNKKEIDYE